MAGRILRSCLAIPGMHVIKTVAQHGKGKVYQKDIPPKRIQAGFRFVRVIFMFHEDYYTAGQSKKLRDCS